MNKMKQAAIAIMVLLAHWMLPTRSVAQWGNRSGGSLPPKASSSAPVRGAQAIEVGGWYYVPVRVVRPSNLSRDDVDAICAEANRVWRVARIGFSFTVDNDRAGVLSLATFDLQMSGAAGLYTGGGRVQVDPDLALIAKGRVLAHELGHFMDLENVRDSSRLMGPLADRNKSGIKLTKQEIDTARTAAKSLTASR